MSTLVSVVIPTYNHTEYLNRAIESALNQSISDIEVIVVDDCSEDNPQSIINSIEDPRLKFISHDKNRGGSAARNTGIMASTGKYIAFLDADDVWFDNKLKHQIELIESGGREWIACYCGWKHVREGYFTQVFSDLVERPSGVEGGKELINPLLVRQLALGGSSTLLVKKWAVEDINGWDERFKRFQDIEFVIRLLNVGKLAYVDRQLVLKNDTGPPPSGIVEQEAVKFLSKFSKSIESAESEGLDVVGAFRFVQAKNQFYHGDFRNGVASLYGSKCPHLRDGLGLVKAVTHGIQVSIKRDK